MLNRSIIFLFIGLPAIGFGCSSPTSSPQQQDAADSAVTTDAGTEDVNISQDGSIADASPGTDVTVDASQSDADAQSDVVLDADAQSDVVSDAADSSAQGSSRVFGVTVTDVWAATGNSAAQLLGHLDGLQGSYGRPTVRAVFDEGIDQVFHTGGETASGYVPSVQALSSRASIMGEVLDSFFVPNYSVKQLTARACEYRATLGHLVDMWEVGNEINGEWVGSQVPEKLRAVIEVFAANGQQFAARCPGFSLKSNEKPFKLALTLYYNGPYDGGHATANNCWEKSDHATLHWAEAHFGSGGDLADLRSNLSYVWLSYYEDDCDNIQPDWPSVYDKLGTVFPKARLGFGECGTTAPNKKSSYVRRYYRGHDSSEQSLANMHIQHPRYVGGMFWWYFSDDHNTPDVYNELVNARLDAFWKH